MQKKKDAILREQVQKLTELYLSQHGRENEGNVTFKYFEDAVTSNFNLNSPRILALHAELFTLVCIGNHFLKRLGPEQVNRLCLAVTDISSEKLSHDSIFRWKTNQLHKYKYEKSSNLDALAKGRHSKLASLFEIFSYNCDDLYICRRPTSLM